MNIKPTRGSGDVTSGCNIYLNSGTVIYTGNGLEIGDDTLIAANCTLAPTHQAFDNPDTPIRLQGFQSSRDGIMSGRDAWIGAHNVAFDGAVIGNGCIVGGGSVVHGTLESFWVYAGHPLAKVKRRGN